MRTTLSLDDDVAAALERRREKEKKPFKQIVNEALRRGLTQPTSRRRPAPFRTAATDLGPCLLPGLDSIGDVLDYLDEAERGSPIAEVAEGRAARKSHR